MYIIGLTGGSGSGKTTVSNYLRKKGFEIIDFDLTTRELQKPGEPALAEIVEAFGPESLLPDGTMNRKYVGKVVFSDPKEKKKMDSIIQKYVDVLITARTDAFREAGRDVTRQTNPKDYCRKKSSFTIILSCLRYRTTSSRQMRRGWWMWMMRPEYSAF